MRHPRVARAATVASAAVLALALGALAAGSGDRQGISDRVVEAFGPAPTMASPVGPAGALAPPQGDELGLPTIPEAAAGPSRVTVQPGLIGELPDQAAAAPVRLVVDGIGVDAAVASVGYDARRAEMEVPAAADLVGWYRFGATPGEAGSAVLAAHVDFNGRAGAFFRLHELEQGARLTVVLDDGSRQRWEVVARRQYGKELLPTDAIFDRGGEPRLALVTCGGPFDGRRYEDNVVVFARPVGAPAAGTDDPT